MIGKKTAGDWLFDIINISLLVLIVVATLYPFITSIAISLNDADDTVRGGITFFPRVFTLRNYELIFRNPLIINAYTITIARTVIGTFTALLFTSLFAFGMAHNNLLGKKFYTILCIIPMYFHGGLIPYFFLVRSLGLMNNFLVYIVPGLVGIWNMILMRTYFRGIPLSLEESARIDGANYFTVFFKVILPVSTPIMAVIALFIGVGQWNAWFDAAIFITREELKPMQNILLGVINEARFAEQLAQLGAEGGGAFSEAAGRIARVNIRSITMATMTVTVLPIIMFYPFLQKYFIKGLMIGSLKG